MCPNSGPDDIGAMRARLQLAGVSFNDAMSVKRGELKKAAADEAHFRALVARLLPSAKEARDGR